MRLFDAHRLAWLAAALCLGQAGCTAESQQDPESEEEEAVEEGSQEISLQSVGAIAAVLVAFHDGEIFQSQLAVDRAQDPAVRSFAAQMIAEHTLANQDVAGLLDTVGADLVENRVSQRITRDAVRQTWRLERTPAWHFDWAYMTAQISMQRLALNLLDSVLIPGAVGLPISPLLIDLRAAVQSHLTFALGIRRNLSRGPIFFP